MISAPVLDFDALLRPIPGTNPAGEPLADTIRMELDINRREPIKGDDTTSHWKSDWPKVLRVTTEALTNTGKDMHTAARLVEAATKVHGVAGLRDGLQLLQRLVAECWDRLHPIPSDGDTTDIRESPVIWLNDIGRGARFPQAVGALTLFRVQGTSFSPLDLRNKELKTAFDEAVAAAKTSVLETLRPTHADLLAAKQALADLTTAFDARRIDKDSTPDYTSPDTSGNLGAAIERCIEMIEDIAKKRDFPLSATPTAASPPPGSSTSSDGMADAPAKASGTREGLYRQLEQIAIALRKLEPHSPIPFLIERCVKLGALPFPELMRAMLHENSAVGELDQLLGIEKK
ncbi:MAG TPA: type VI secretion system ImpA family N-terminal domain-containing protein [Gemmata sp.]|nr:type VI secretion system ImpA family N-terminal domain-containing protein [Gemmata sp.]